jgi:hypothetical protein
VKLLCRLGLHNKIWLVICQGRKEYGEDSRLECLRLVCDRCHRDIRYRTDHWRYIRPSFAGERWFGYRVKYQLPSGGWQ